MNQVEAQVIASAVSCIRPDWLQSSMVKLLAKQRHRPARQVALALVAMAYDPEVKTPGLLNHKTGEVYFTVANPLEPTYTPPANSDIQCRTHGDRPPCRGCRSEAIAVPTEPIEPPQLERAEGETLIQYARRIADMHNPQEPQA